MNAARLYNLDIKLKKLLIECHLSKYGKCISVTSGKCGEIYTFDLGANVAPRYLCAKIPIVKNLDDYKIYENRLVAEVKNQLSYYKHNLVHWVCDFTEINGTPVVLSRFWGSDVQKLILEDNASDVERLSILIYTAIGLKHCYKKGLIAHQDLKPANIFLRDLTKEYPHLPRLNIYNQAIIGDFGLANAASTLGVYDGSRPYMAPEQWSKESLTQATDIFALGVIIFEIMTHGLHPVGIKINEFWPKPQNKTNGVRRSQ